MSDPKKEFLEQVYDLACDYEHQGRAAISSAWGLCATCSEFYFAATGMGNERAHCGYTEKMSRWPSRTDPIKKCARYETRGRVYLTEMANVAAYKDRKKNHVGF